MGITQQPLKSDVEQSIETEVKTKVKVWIDEQLESIHERDSVVKFNDDTTKQGKLLSDQVKELNLQLDELHKVKVQMEKDIQKNELTFK